MLLHAPKLAQIFLQKEIPCVGVGGNDARYKSMDGGQELDFRVTFVLFPR